MRLDAAGFERVLGFFRELGLVTDSECHQVRALFDPGFPWVAAVELAESVHLLAYYTAATGEEGALTRREKVLIGLAVAHAKQRPYCIDAYTGSCLERGATVELMHEAIHVAAALSAGIDPVHGVQMRNALATRGAL